MIETKYDLRDETFAELQELIRANIDSEKGFLLAADTVADASIAALFRLIAKDRASNAAELQQHVAVNHETPNGDGSTLGAVYRWWLSARGALNGGEDHVVLNEAERGEDRIKHRYEIALNELPASALNDVLMRQYARVKEQHDQIRALRDTAGAA